MFITGLVENFEFSSQAQENVKSREKRAMEITRMKLISHHEIFSEEKLFYDHKNTVSKLKSQTEG